mgnify:CR=1 FL=1
MSNPKDFNLKSIDVLNRYIALLTKEQDELYKHLNLVLGQDRQLSDSDDWNDKNHHQFSEEFVVDIQRQLNAAANSYELAIERLKNLKQQYSLIIN